MIDKDVFYFQVENKTDSINYLYICAIIDETKSKT